MSLDYLNAAFKCPVKPSSLKFVLVALADYANEIGEAYPSTETLENKTSQDRKTILKNVAQLIDLGLAYDTGERKGRTKQIPVYRLSISDIKEFSMPENSPKNGTVKQSQKRNSTKNGTVPFLPENSPKNGTVKQSQKRYTEPSAFYNHQEEPSDDDVPAGEVIEPEQPKQPEKKENIIRPYDSPELFMDLFNEVLPELETLKVMTFPRLMIIQRLEQEGLLTMEDWREYFLKVRESDYLMGRLGNKPTSIRWLLDSENHANIIENFYKNDDSKTHQATTDMNDIWDDELDYVFAKRQAAQGVN